MADAPGLTVEQLAYESGMSVRNIRNHQSRGLLPPPEVRARVGYYGRQHVERLRLIQQMQAEGFKLTAIQRLIGDEGDAVERYLGLRRAITAPSDTESPEVLTTEELAERFGPVEENARAMQKAQKLGVLVPLGDGRFEAPSPALLRAAEEVVRRGVPLAAALSVIERVHRHSRSVAQAFVQLFLDDVWKPFERDGRPEERWPEITESIERLRPLASEALLAMFKQTMTAEVEDAFGKVLERQGRSGKRD
jgi:DNA-binding transcriptional MerR regulator